MKSDNLKVGEQKVYFKSSEMMDEIDDGLISFVITSPPYWNLKNYNHPDQIGQENYNQYIMRMNKVWDECYRVTKDNGLLLINVNSRRREKKFYPLALDIYSNMKKWNLIDILIWYVPNALPQPNYYINKLFDNKYEFLLVFAKNYKYDYVFNKIRVMQKYVDVDPRKDKYNPKGRCIGNVIRIPAYRPPNIKKRNYYVSAYPEELVYLFLNAFTNMGDFVLDPFLGSGTTLKVCRLMNRFGIGYEIDKTYKDMIKDRILEKWNPPPFDELDIINSTFYKNNKNNKPRRPKIKKLNTYKQRHINKSFGVNVKTQKNKSLNTKNEVKNYGKILEEFVKNGAPLVHVKLEEDDPKSVEKHLKKIIIKNKLNYDVYTINGRLYIEKPFQGSNIYVK